MDSIDVLGTVCILPCVTDITTKGKTMYYLQERDIATGTWERCQRAYSTPLEALEARDAAYPTQNDGLPWAYRVVDDYGTVFDYCETKIARSPHFKEPRQLACPRPLTRRAT